MFTADDYSITLEIDGWSDVSNRSIMGMVASITSPDKRKFVICVEDHSSESHTAENMFKFAEKHINKLDIAKVNGFVTDNAANGKATRRKVEDKFLSVICYRCSANFINLIAKETNGPSTLKQFAVTR